MTLYLKRPLFIISFFFASACTCCIGSCNNNETIETTLVDTSCWVGPGIYEIPTNKTGDSIRYGRSLICSTAYYIGPKGKIASITNGMNCSNCHLDAGTKPWGNNFGAVASNYPLYRERSGSIETIEKRINDCMQRSLNGQALDSNSYELKSMVAYIKWVGKNIPKNTTPKGVGIQKIPLLSRAASPSKGEIVYLNYCQKCHGINGEGELNQDQIGYKYPPVWGKNSYNVSAGLYRLSRFAGFVKNNMPNPSNYHNPTLSNEEAWDVAAFVNSQSRPIKKWNSDWPHLEKKPADHPFGPYADTLSEIEHKYGPWKN